MVRHCYWGTCTADARYPERIQGRLIPFPRPKTNLERCLRWIKACGRPHYQLNVARINKNKAVCSKHFLGEDGPTDEYPDPVQADGLRVRPSRPKRRKNRSTRQVSTEEHNSDHNSHHTDASTSVTSDLCKRLQTEEHLNGHLISTIAVSPLSQSIPSGEAPRNRKSGLMFTSMSKMSKHIEIHGQCEEFGIKVEENSASVDVKVEENAASVDVKVEENVASVDVKVEENVDSVDVKLEEQDTDACYAYASKCLLNSAAEEDEVLLPVEKPLPDGNVMTLPQNVHSRSCNYTFKSEKQIASCNNIMTLQTCPVCQVNCWSKETLAAHMQTHSYTENYQESKKRTHSESECEIDDSKNTDIRDSVVTFSKSKGSPVHSSVSLPTNTQTTQAGRFCCSVCKINFINIQSLTVHKNTEGHYKCVECHVIVGDEKSLKNHLKNHSQCALCKVTFSGKKSLLDNHINCHPKCSVCECRFMDKQCLADHIKCHPKCSLCECRFMNVQSLFGHFEIHPQCSVCKGHFLDHRVLNLHMKRHPNCNVCLLHFATEKSIEKHMISHLNCDMCRSRVENIDFYKKHIKNNLSAGRCYVCKAEFANGKSLEGHMKRHSICTLCNCNFSSIESLKKHMVRHPFCFVCKQYFSRLHLLEEHMKKEGHRRCNQCDMMVNDDQVFADHCTLHPQCRVCGIHVMQQAHLESHMKTHMQCSVCMAWIIDDIFPHHPAKQRHITLF